MRHVLSLSGGKDSAALAIYMRDKVPNMEYVFWDTRKELPDTYEYLERIEDYLGMRVIRFKAELGFDHLVRCLRRHDTFKPPSLVYQDAQTQTI